LLGDPALGSFLSLLSAARLHIFVSFLLTHKRAKRFIENANSHLFLAPVCQELSEPCGHAHLDDET